MKSKTIGDIEITASDETVWVNAHTNCVGRFGAKIYEVVTYNSLFQPRFVAAGFTGDRVSWSNFADAIEAHYKITIPDEFIPDRLKEAA